MRHARTLGLCAVLLLIFSAPATAQDQPEIKVPVNPLLERHSNWFKPRKIYDIKKDHFPLQQVPADLRYDVYSAVGYEFANTIIIKGPARADGTRELVIVDTLGNPEITRQTIQQFREQVSGRLGRVATDAAS